jgi:predicted nucleotidyltransferase
MDRARLAEIARAHGADLVVQFGSSVAGTLHARSDLDLAVLFRNPPASLFDTADLTADLQALSPEREIDLVILNYADPLLLEQIAGHGVLLYGEPSRWQRLRLYAFKRYQDHRRFLQMEREYVERAIAAARR